MNAALSFLQYDVVTKINMVNQVEIVFPTVFICVDYEKDLTSFSCRFHSENATSNLYAMTYADQKCLVFNGGRNISGHFVEPLKLKEVGTQFALQIRMYMKSSGLVRIYVGDTLALPQIKEIGRLSIEKGILTEVYLTKLSVKDLPYPYNNCEQNLNTPSSYDSDLYRTTFANGFTYRQKNCFDTCACKAISVTCGCTCPGVYETSSSTNCYDQNCFKNQLTSFNSTEECSRDCPLECDTSSYSTSVQTLSYLFTGPSTFDKKMFNDFIKLFKNSLDPLNMIELRGVGLNVIMNDMRYMEITQSAKMTGTDLVSNIGGCLGLFLGMSLLSFFEIFEYLIQIVYLIGDSFKPRSRIVESS